MNMYDDFRKAMRKRGGEGSRGGHVIGHTKSGKPIYDALHHHSHKRFSRDDHRDATRAHALRRDALRRASAALDDAFPDKFAEMSTTKRREAAQDRSRVIKDIAVRAAHHERQRKAHAEASRAE